VIQAKKDGAAPAIKLVVVEWGNADSSWLRKLLAGSKGRAFELETSSPDGLPDACSRIGEPDGLLVLLPGDEADPAERVREIVDGQDGSPVLVIGEQEEEAFAFEMLRAGASSYLAHSDVGPRLLATTLELAGQKHRALVNLRKAHQRAFHLNTHDPVTQLGNRFFFRDQVAQASALAKRTERLLAVLFLDLGGLRAINETLGHAAGDHLLFHVSQRLEETVRGTDVVHPESERSRAAVSRLGGGEFTILLTEIADPGSAVRVAQRLLEALAHPFEIDDREVRVRASIGIALFPTDGENADELIRNAHAAMNRAKTCGPDTVRFFAQPMNDEAERKLELARHLHRAIERDELSVHYQPVRDAQSSRLMAAEALLRWNSPAVGNVSPAEFIPIAEETGLIVPIGEWVLRTACGQVEAWRNAGLQPIRLAVNLSVHQLRAGSLGNMVVKALRDTGLSAGQLELEITETALLENDESAIREVSGLRDLGVGLALDDFGTGYSGLTHLRRFPIDRLKIDGSFTAGIAINRNDADLTRAVIAMAHALRLSVVAEGVETIEQATVLRQHHCDELQGFLFSAAVPADDFARILEEEKLPRN
jgi:diguanylate cyclase (GGDEF)-like protein